MPSDIMFLDLAVESSAGNIEQSGGTLQVPVCFFQYLSDQSFFCLWKRTVHLQNVTNLKEVRQSLQNEASSIFIAVSTFEKIKQFMRQVCLRGL